MIDGTVRAVEPVEQSIARIQFGFQRRIVYGSYTYGQHVDVEKNILHTVYYLHNDESTAKTVTYIDN